MRCRAKYKNFRGFTLVEILIVLTIFIFISGFALLVSMGSFRSHSFQNERDTAVSILQKARGQAINNICLGNCGGNNGLPHGVHATNAYYVIFQGNSYNPGDSTNQIIPVNSKVTLTDAANNPPADIIFNQLDGGANETTLRMVDDAGHNSNITINSEGQIMWSN